MRIIQRHFTNHDVARIAMFAALFGVFSFVRIPVGPVPITLQNLALMLAGTILGAVSGMLSVTALLVLVLVGLPLLGGNGGPAVFVGPTAGYLYGFIIGTFVIGLIAHCGRRLVWWKTALACVIGGMLIPYALGIPVTAAVVGEPVMQAAAGALVFIPGDLTKMVIASVLVGALFRAYPQAFPEYLRDEDDGIAADPSADSASDSGSSAGSSSAVDR